MKFIIILVLFYSNINSQKKYINGQNGIELFHKSKDTMYIYHQHQAKMEVKFEVAYVVLNEYLKIRNQEGLRTVCTIYGEVKGLLKITRKPNLVLLDFQYLSILWNDGILEETIIKEKK